MTREKKLHYLKMFLVIFMLSDMDVLLNGYRVQAAGSSAAYKKAYTKKLNNIRKKKSEKSGSFMGSFYAMKGKKSKYKFETWTGVGAYSYGYVTFKKSMVI